jgi:hypothetical protein
MHAALLDTFYGCVAAAVVVGAVFLSLSVSIRRATWNEKRIARATLTAQQEVARIFREAHAKMERRSGCSDPFGIGSGRQRW